MNKKKRPGEIKDFWLRNLKPKPGMPSEIYTENDGFAVRILESGTITFLFMFKFLGKRRQINLGKYPETSLARAKKLHRDAFDKVADGIDPQAQEAPVPEVVTVSTVKKEFVEEWSALYYSPRWHANVVGALEADVMPFIGDRPIQDVKRKDIIEIITRVAGRAPGQARNVYKALSKLFWFAKKIKEYYDSENPCTDILDAIPTLRPGEGKKRTLTDLEIKKLWKRIDRFAGSDSVKRALKMVLVTGQRPEEVVEMHSDEIVKMQSGTWWIIPWKRIKTECSKTLRRPPVDHTVYLSPLAQSLLLGGKGYMFPSPLKHKNPSDTSKPTTPNPIRRNSLSQRVERPDIFIFKKKDGGTKKVKITYYGLKSPWGPHDLRRTVRTGMSKLGIMARHAEEVLNHKVDRITGTYDIHKYDREKKAALRKWATHLEHIINHPVILHQQTEEEEN